jgi:hypothetical protein
MSRFPLAAAVLTLALAGPSRPAPAAPIPAQAGKDITLPYPAKAPIVLHLHGLEQARDRLNKMLSGAVPAEAAKLNAHIDAGLKQLLEGRSLKAVPKDGRVFVVVHDIAKLFDEEPVVSVVVPVTDYKAFRESFLTADERKSFEPGKDTKVDSVKSVATGDETTVYLVDLKEYVALTPDRGTADQYAGKFTPATTGAMGLDLGTSFLAADIGLFVNMDVINDLYGEQIRGFKGLLDFAFGQAELGGMLPGLNKKQMEGMKQIFAGMFQAVEDSRGLVLGLEFRPEGLNIRFQTRFADDSASARFLKPEQPTPLPELARLPRGQSSYSGSRFGPKVTEVMSLLAQQFGAAEDDEKGAERVEKLSAELAAAGPQGEYTAGSAPDQSLNVATYKDPAKAVAAEVKLYQSLAAGGRVANVVLKERPKVTEAAQKHHGFTFTEVRLAFDFEATVKDLPDPVRESTLAQMKRMAREQTTNWIGTDGKVVLTVTAKDWETARKLIDDYLDGRAPAGSDPGFRLTRQNLPDQATMITLAETGEMLKAMAESVKSVADAVPGFPLQLRDLKPVKGDPTYLGVAVTLKGETATVDVFVPGTAMAVGWRMLAPLFRPGD